MTLLLTSNGLQGKIKDIFPTLLGKPAKENSVAFVTTAAYEGEDDPSGWLNKYRQQLLDQGITNVEDVDLRDKPSEELEKILATKDIVYVNGGNTLLLLYWVRKSGFDRVLQKFLADGKLYIGVSAGSVICCPTIETALYDLGGEYTPDKNIIGLTDFTGLSLVPFLISPHLNAQNKEAVRQQAAKATLPVIALTDQQAILIKENKRWEIIGDGEKSTFGSKK